MAPDESVKEMSEQIIYFDKETKKMEAASLTHQNMVATSKDGLIKTTFTDSDFKIPSACDGVPISEAPANFRSFMQ